MDDQEAYGVPVYLDQNDPEIDDPSVELKTCHWQPACKSTNKLVRCLEAFRDTKAAIGPMVLSPNPDCDKRQLKQSVVPIYNLALALRDLYNDLQSRGWPKILPEERKKAGEKYRVFQEKVNTKNGPLKTARDKIGAHIDKDPGGSGARDIWREVNTYSVLCWIGACVQLFMPLLTADAFSWTRESGDPKTTRLMNIDGREVVLQSSHDHGVSLVGLSITASPKIAIEKEVLDLVAACHLIKENLDNKMA